MKETDNSLEFDVEIDLSKERDYDGYFGMAMVMNKLGVTEVVLTNPEKWTHNKFKVEFSEDENTCTLSLIDKKEVEDEASCQ